MRKEWRKRLKGRLYRRVRRKMRKMKKMGRDRKKTDDEEKRREAGKATFSIKD